MAELIFNTDPTKTYCQFTKILDSIEYKFYIQYVARSDSWIMGVGDNVKGISITRKDDILRNFHHHDDVPIGKLQLEDLDGLVRDPTRDTFSTRIFLKYIEQ